MCLKGRLIDKNTHKIIGGAAILEKKNDKSAVSDSLGMFELCDLDTLLLHVEISHVNYESKVFILSPADYADFSVLNFELSEKVNLLRELEVESAEKNKIQSAQFKLSQQEIRQLPAILGETDILRAIQILPGVKSASEGIGGIFVRGGNAGHNLFIYDDMEIHNPTHLMGVSSAFNSLTSTGIELYMGHSPIEHQAYLSSSIVVSSMTPKTIRPELLASIGNISSTIACAGIDKTGKLTYVLGARRSFLELFNPVTSFLIPDSLNYFKQYGYYFYDLNGNIKYHFSAGKILTLSWYMGKDDFRTKEISSFRNASSSWGNQNLLLSYQYKFSPSSIMKHSLTYAKVHSEFAGSIFDNSLDYSSSLSEIKLKNLLKIYQEKFNWTFGLELFNSSNMPQNMELIYMGDSIHNQENFINKGLIVFFGNDMNINENNKVYFGIRYTTNFSMRPWDLSFDKPLFSWSPSISYSYKIDLKKSLKLSYSRNAQQLHLCSFSSIPMPNDIWMNSTTELLPETADQITLSLTGNNKHLEWSVEAYGKWMNNLLILNVDIDERNNRNYEDNFYVGMGKALGMDVHLAYKQNRLNGTLNYTLSRSIRSFPEIMHGEWFNDKYDRRHDLKMVMNYEISERWSTSLLWSYATGNTTTVPVGRWWMLGSVMNDYDGYNNFRFPDYHRLDLAANYKLSSGKLKESVLTFSIINAYNRANPYFLVYQINTNGSQYNIKPKVLQTSLFPVMPSVAWRFKL